MVQRCTWAKHSSIEREYHDAEWGVPVHDDTKLFEFLLLEGAQAGLSWLTVLKKRENYRLAFDYFDWNKIARYDEQKIAKLLQNEGIIRNKLKVHSAVTNAKAFQKIISEWGSFDRYIWHFTNGKTIQNKWKEHSDVPASTPLSDTISKDLKKRGFKFVGTTIIYAYLQAVGIVNDHLTSCFRHKELV